MADENCVEGLGNTGSAGCITLADVARMGLLDMAKDSAGAPKERPNTDITTLAGVTAAINADDPLDRLYPLGKLDQVEHLRAEDVFFSSNSGQEFFIRPGYKKLTAMIYGATRELEGKLNKNRGQNFGWHYLDDKNQAVTKKGNTTSKCRPILIADQTFRAKYFEKTDTDPAGVGIVFQWKSTEEDPDVKVLNGLDYTREDIEGLVDYDATFSAISVNGFTADFYAVCFPTVPAEGLLLADISLAEITPTPADITGNIASMTPTATPGQYEFLFTVPETLGDVLRLSASRDGEDYSAMSNGSNDITITP